MKNKIKHCCQLLKVVKGGDESDRCVNKPCELDVPFRTQPAPDQPEDATDFKC